MQRERPVDPKCPIFGIFPQPKSHGLDIPGPHPACNCPGCKNSSQYLYLLAFPIDNVVDLKYHQPR